MDADCAPSADYSLNLSKLPEPQRSIIPLRAMQVTLLIFIPLLLAKTYSLNITIPAESFSWPLIEGKMLSRSVDCFRSHGGDVCYIHVKYEQRGLESTMFELVSHDLPELFPFTAITGYRES